jgi:hypothetical protein
MSFADSITGKFWRIAPMLSLPQIPQLDEMVPKRCAELSLTLMPSASAVIMMLSRFRPAAGREKLAICSGV